MTTPQEAYSKILKNKDSILSTVRFRNDTLFNKFSELTGIPSENLAEGDDDTKDFDFCIKIVALAKELQEFNNNKYSDELELMSKFNEFNSYISQSLLAFLFHPSNDPLARHGDEEMSNMAFHFLSELAQFSELEAWSVMSILQIYEASANLTSQLYQMELSEEEISGVNADTVQKVYDALEKYVGGNEEMHLLLTNSFCFVMAVVLKLLLLGKEKPVHEFINSSFVVEGDDFLTLIEGFKNKYSLYIGSYTKLLESVEGKVSEISLTKADWKKGLLGFQFENDIVVAQNPLNRGGSLVFTISKQFKEYTSNSGVKIEVNSFSIFN